MNRVTDPGWLKNADLRRQMVDNDPSPKSQEENWQKYEIIANVSSEFMTLVDQNYVYEMVNEAYCQAHNKTRMEILGRTMAEIWGEE